MNKLAWVINHRNAGKRGICGPQEGEGRRWERERLVRRVCTGRRGVPVLVPSTRPDLEMRGAAVGSGAGIQPLDPSGS